MIVRALFPATLAAVLSALPVAATAPETSLRPQARTTQTVAVSAAVQEASVQVAAAEAAAFVVSSRARPVSRPVSDQLVQVAARPADLPSLGPDVSLRPYMRPKAVEEEAFFKRRKKRKGSVCGNIEIQGQAAGDIPGKIRGCGITDAVRVTSVSGVRLSRPSLMTCDTARSLNKWVDRSVIPTFRRRGPVVELKIAAHYSCRTRNNRPGAKISEHGKGRAIDISAFRMKDGEEITVLEGWKRGSTRKMLRRVWKAACGPFGTVLGPNADRYHRDHFHLDTARHRGGAYCR
ncbi:hypothetical protein TRL7639_01059 [Falsiruegeria litorea R37]|uniref:Extensin-like C-terminal domain-containing protein n=1 Tax=Falsiruegeria litorea R37 TaxID=1200284 RepID=A0A1Y5RXX3_9RHOB|nr:extensin family protein [Falsiruegeria litorea]SLN27781.1 hypothetical protein TRL7639_01059 [Falsiruegeria litorea R37]